MLFNGVLETTTGVTTGDLALTGVTNRSRFSDAFAVNATEASADIFFYSILTQDAIPILVEQGIGWLSATGTLKRATVLVTFSAGVPTYMGSAFSLTSGSTYNVICTPEAGSLDPGLHDVMAASGNFLRTLGPNHFCGTASTVSMVKDRLHYCPIFLNSPQRIGSIKITNGGTAGTSGTNGFNVAIYSALRTGGPGRKLFQSGNLASSAFAALSATITSTRLPAGWYYGAVAHDYAGTTPTAYGSTSTAPGAVSTPLGHQNTQDSVLGCYEALTGGWASSSGFPAVASATPTRVGSGATFPTVLLGLA